MPYRGVYDSTNDYPRECGGWMDSYLNNWILSA